MRLWIIGDPQVRAAREFLAFPADPLVWHVAGRPRGFRAHLLFQVAPAAYETQSAVFAASLDLSRRGVVFGGDQMAAVVIDQGVHRGRLLRFKGESCRVRRASMQGGAQKACQDPV